MITLTLTEAELEHIQKGLKMALHVTGNRQNIGPQGPTVVFMPPEAGTSPMLEELRRAQFEILSDQMEGGLSEAARLRTQAIIQRLVRSFKPVPLNLGESRDIAPPKPFDVYDCPFFCKVCRNTFSTENNLEAHQWRKHGFVQERNSVRWLP